MFCHELMVCLKKPFGGHRRFSFFRNQMITTLILQRESYQTVEVFFLWT